MRCPSCHRLVEGTLCPRDGARLAEAAVADRAWPVPADCEIEGVLGAGGYAVVLAARRRGRDVAVKCALDGRDDRLAREALALTRVAPPHVPRLLDRGPGYLVLERLAQPSLAQLVARGTGDLAAIARGLFEAVAAVHAVGLVHGDLSPLNVFFDGTTATLIDFGLAHHATAGDTRDGDPALRSSEARPRSDTALRQRTTDLGAGTLHYLAPEVLRGEPATAASDVYACGAMLYEVAAGLPPFVGDAGDVAHAIALLRPPPLPTSAIAPVIFAALAKDPARRPTAAFARASPSGSPHVPATLPRVSMPQSPIASTDSGAPASLASPTVARGARDDDGRQRVVLLGCAGVAIPQVERAVVEESGIAVRQRGGRTIAMFAPRSVADPLTAALRTATRLVERGGRCALHVADVEVMSGRASGAALDRLDWWPPGDAKLHLTEEAAPLFEQREPPLVGRGAIVAAILGARDRVAASRRPAVVTVLGDRGSGRTRLAAALRELVPDAKVIDDAHAADPIALAAVDTVLVRDTPVLVVALANRNFRELFPAWAVGVEDTTELELGPLPGDAALELARHALDDEFAPHALLAGLCELAAGHPKTLVDAARLAKLSGRAELPRAPAPGFLATEVLERLPPELARFVDVLALAGSALAPVELEDIAGSRIDGGAAVIALASRGLARPVGAGWELHPASLVTAIGNRMDPDEARRIHAAALACLAARDGDRAERARHARGAGDATAATELYEALVAEANAAHDYLAAERWASSALDAGTARDSRRAHLLILRGAMRWRRHRIADALADLDAAHADGDPHTAALADLEAAIALDWAGDYAASWERAQRAATVRDPDIALGVRLAEGRHAFRAQRFAEAAPILRDVAARATGQTEIIALCLLGPALSALGDLDEAAAVFDRAFAACERDGDRIHLAVALANRSFLWSARRRPDAQRADLERCIALARELGNPLVERVPAWNMAEMLYWEGRDVEALAYARRTAELAARFLEPVPEDALLAARIAVSRGDLATARERLAWIAERCDPEAFQPVVRLVIAALRVILDGGDGWDAILEAAERELPEDELVELWYLRARAAPTDAARARVRELATRWPIWQTRADAL